MTAKQSGVALITALLITALVTVAAVAMATHQQLDVRRTGNMLEADQAYMYSLGGEILAKQLLSLDGTNNVVDTLTEEWNVPLPVTQVEGGAIAGQIVDLNRQFNLNNLVGTEGKVEPEQVKILQRILEYLSRNDEGIDFSPFIANRVVDWIDADLNALADGAEDLEYLNADEDGIPYRTANRYMASPSELLAIEGLRDKESRKGTYVLMQYVAALPGVGRINVNTASLPILQSLHEDMDENVASDIIERREEEPFEDIQDFVAMLANEYDIQLDTDYVSRYLSVESHYFLATVNANIGRTTITLNSILYRENGQVKTLSRSLGEL